MHVCTYINVHVCIYCPQALKSEYNSLSPSYATCHASGEAMAALLVEEEEGEGEGEGEKGALERANAALQEDWRRLGECFGDLVAKLTNALLQTQEFQKVADDLSQWMGDMMRDTLGKQGLVAARKRLLEGQIQCFKVHMYMYVWNVRDVSLFQRWICTQEYV